MDISQSINATCKQQGATLIVALVMLLLITMIALTSMQGTAMQQHMSSNMKDRDIAFQSAEVGLRVAEQWLASKNSPNTYSYSSKECSGESVCRVYKTGPQNNPVDDDLDSLNTVQNWLDKSLDISAFNGGVIKGVSEQPRVTIELMDSQPDDRDLGGGYGDSESGRNIYRQTARSTGGSGRAEVILQSHYAIRYN
ncbi:MAG: PilX N-terminal domain-containing pilus assembly protein [Amphritea sp.]